MKSLPGLVAAAALLAAAASLGALPPQGHQDLPADEEKLYQHAVARMNQGLWLEADRAFKVFLEKFPQGKMAEAVHFQLGNLHLWHSRRHAEAREWYAKLCERFPKSPSYWSYRFHIAHAWQHQGLRERALEELEKIVKEAPDPQVRVQAVQQGWSLKGKSFHMSVNQSFTAGQEPVARVNLQKIDKVAYRATHIRYDRLLEHLVGDDAQNLLQVVAKVGKEGRRLVREWTAEYSYPADRGWRQEAVKVPSTEAGVYIVEGEHEGVTMTVTILVSRYGLITKSAAGKLVCFAQDRATSRPVEGLAIRVLNKQHPLQGVTGADGLFVSEAYRGGLIVGLKDGDLLTTQTHYSGAPGAQPLVYVTTDRPIYRPNQTVHFRVLYRMEEGRNLELRPGQKVVVEIHDPKGNRVYEQDHAFNEFGSTSGRIVLGDEPPLGEYMVYARPPGSPNDWAWRWGPNGHNMGRFRVDEYRKPEYEVDVEFKRSPVLQGEAVEGAVRARYYFGSPVADADVTYTVFRRGHWWQWRCWEFYYDWYTEDEEDAFEGKHARRWWGHGEQVLQGTGKTDAEGRLRIAFTAAKWDHDAVYTVVAQVTDLSRRVVEGSGVCKATRAEFGLAMSLNKHVYTPGERVNAKVRATTADDKPVPDQAVTLRAYDRQWRDGRHHDRPLFEGTSRTDAQGVAEFNVTPEVEGGYIVLVAEARDRRENRVSAEQWVWLFGSGWHGDTVNLNGIDLVLDRKTYNVGETARILVTSQFKDVTLLFTVEGKEIHEATVVPVRGHAKVVEFKIDQAAFAPNIFVSLMAIKENQVVHKRRMLVVNPSGKFVAVEVKPDKDQYRPRQKARYEVRTTGADGRPVAAEVALGIVDESIYALQDEYAPDIRKHFIHKRWAQVATSTSLYYHDWGRAQLREQAKGEWAAGAKEADGMDRLDESRPSGPGRARDKKDAGGKAYAATEIRSRFADTMLWTTVTTDASGRAVVEVDIPDNLTTWRATARAVTADSRFGQETNSIVTRKSMIVRLETPRFFTQNDETVISAIAHNYLAGEKEVRIELAAEGIEVAGEREMLVRVAPGGQKRIDWKARIRAACAATLTVKALTDEDSDAMRLVVPVLAHGAMKWDAKAGIVQDRVVERVRLPGGAVKGASELVVVVSPTHASMVLDALEYLAGYPYGCVEQTMSRFLPTVVVSRALQKLGLEKPGLQAELPQMVAAGLQRLYNFQQQDGGWGWWQNDQSNPWTTAYVVLGLAMAREADHRVEENVFERGIQALQAHLGKATDANQQSYLLYALSVAGRRSDVARDRLTDRLGELGAYSKALLALVLRKDGRSAKEALASLARDAKVVGGAAHFAGGQGGGWMDHAVEATAAGLRAFLAVDPKHELVPRLVHWLALSRQGHYWASTKQTAMAVFALVEYLAATGDLNPDMTITLSLNGDRVYAERVTKENWHKFEGMKKFAASQLNAGENEIVIEKTGTGAPAYSIYAKYYAEAEDLEASEGGIQIERSYSLVRNDKGERRLERLASGAELRSGDEIEVTLTVSADRNYEWLMLEDPLPSGFEPVREYWGHYGWHWNYWYSRKEFRDERVSIAMTALAQGRHTASYTMRAETPGDFHALPAVVFNMYHPSIGANSAEFRIRVKDRN